MELVTVREIFRNKEEYLNKEITIGGWVRSIRDGKTFGFIVLNDGSFLVNVRTKKSLPRLIRRGKPSVNYYFA